MALSLYASSITKGRFRKYSQYTTRSRMTGAQVAQGILDDNNIRDVRIEPVGGELTDHYDPRTKTLRLSQSVYSSNSMAAFGVAAHEVGHAIQHAKSYTMLSFRSAWVPVANLGRTFNVCNHSCCLIGGANQLLVHLFHGLECFYLDAHCLTW